MMSSLPNLCSMRLHCPKNSLWYEDMKSNSERILEISDYLLLSLMKNMLPPDYEAPIFNYLNYLLLIIGKLSLLCGRCVRIDQNTPFPSGFYFEIELICW